jgi:hypothetical protein
MTIQRLENVGIVVEDLAAATAFLATLVDAAEWAARSGGGSMPSDRRSRGEPSQP